MAGEAKVDEPLPVEHLRHVFENLDAPGVVLDQVVVGTQHSDYRVLRVSWRDANQEFLKTIRLQSLRSMGRFISDSEDVVCVRPKPVEDELIGDALSVESF